MRAMRHTIVLGSCIFLLSFASACGDDDSGGTSAAQIDRACRTFCGKFAECDLLLGMSADACASSCRNQAMMGSGGSDCEVSDSEADACIEAIGAAECSALSSGTTPPECDLCPSSTPQPPPPGSPDAGTGGMSCSELGACCSQLPMEAQSGCTSLAEAGVESTCGTVLSGYRAAGMCS